MWTFRTSACRRVRSSIGPPSMARPCRAKLALSSTPDTFGMPKVPLPHARTMPSTSACRSIGKRMSGPTRGQSLDLNHRRLRHAEEFASRLTTELTQRWSKLAIITAEAFGMPKGCSSLRGDLDRCWLSPKRSSPDLIIKKVQLSQEVAHAMSYSAGKMSSPQQEVSDGNQQGAASAGPVDARIL